MKAKRLISLALIVVMLFTINTTTFATDNGIEAADDSYISSFIDGEGKINKVHISSERKGTSHVDYYIEDVLINTVDVEIIGVQSAGDISFDGAENVRIRYTDVETLETYEFTESVSDYITSVQANGRVPSATPAVIASYSYQGRINYNTYNHPSGSYTDKLYIYQEAGTVRNEIKVINAAAGTAASVVVGVISAALAIYCPALAIVSTDVLYAAIYAAGTTILGGVIQGAITKNYIVQVTPYNVKALDISTSRERIYDAERYQVQLSGGGYSSDYYYDGYLPWNSTGIAYLMFCDFWSYSYPGVSSFT